jgi:hypothetical protein
MHGSSARYLMVSKRQIPTHRFFGLPPLTSTTNSMLLPCTMHKMQPSPPAHMPACFEVDANGVDPVHCFWRQYRHGQSGWHGCMRANKTLPLTLHCQKQRFSRADACARQPPLRPPPSSHNRHMHNCYPASSAANADRPWLLLVSCATGGLSGWRGFQPQNLLVTKRHQYHT